VSSGGKIRPCGFPFHEGVHEGQEFPHAGGHGDFAGFAGGDQALEELPDRGIPLPGRPRGHVQHAAFETPSGYEFELQFHPQASFEAKGTATHSIYEKQEKYLEGSDEYLELKQQQAEIFKTVPIPPGAKDIKGDTQ
jgi:hypothetical protein